MSPRENAIFILIALIVTWLGLTVRGRQETMRYVVRFGKWTLDGVAGVARESGKTAWAEVTKIALAATVVAVGSIVGTSAALHYVGWLAPAFEAPIEMNVGPGTVTSQFSDISSGVEPIFSDDFESGVVDPTGGEWYKIENVVVSADTGRGSSSYALKFTADDGLIEYRFGIDKEGVTEWWVEWYELFPTGLSLPDTSQFNKLFAFSAGDTATATTGAHPITGSCTTSGGGCDYMHGGYGADGSGGWAVRIEFAAATPGPEAKVRTTWTGYIPTHAMSVHECNGQMDGNDHGMCTDSINNPASAFTKMYPNAPTYAPDSLIVESDLGTWVKWQAHVKLSTTAYTVLSPDTYHNKSTDMYLSDGLIEFAKNDLAFMVRDSLLIGGGYAAPGLANPLCCMELMGAANDAYNAGMIFYIDDVKLYDVDPGWAWDTGG